MKQAKMEELLVRFMDGETSVEEETALAGYFCNATDDEARRYARRRLEGIQGNVPSA